MSERAPAGASPDAVPPLQDDERQVRNLIRWVSGFVAWPALSISLVMFLEWEEHVAHIAGLLPLGLVAVVVFFRAPRLARRLAPEL